MKPFNLEEAKAGKPVQTRDGKDVRILAFDRKGNMPIVGLVPNRECEISYYFFADGKAASISDESGLDLFMKSEKKEGWINIYHGYTENSRNVGKVFYTEREALEEGKQSVHYVTTVKVEWEE